MRKPFNLKYLLPSTAVALTAVNGYIIYDRYQKNTDPQKTILNAFKRFQDTPNPQQTFAEAAIKAINRTNAKKLVNELNNNFTKGGKTQRYLYEEVDGYITARKIDNGGGVKGCTDGYIDLPPVETSETDSKKLDKRLQVRTA